MGFNSGFKGLSYPGMPNLLQNPWFFSVNNTPSQEIWR